MRKYMAKNIGEGTKVVQTEVTASLYERFAAAASAREMTIKEAVREAIADFTYRNEPIGPDDPILAPLSGDAEVTSTDDDASERVDEILYGERD